ncbi:hypothetical protein SC1_03628 [Sphingopyxis sp. C-1]|nr:hypothetical protein SC1_03628 [Sphingopyxis sp. C-1]
MMFHTSFINLNIMDRCCIYTSCSPLYRICLLWREPLAAPTFAQEAADARFHANASGSLLSCGQRPKITDLRQSRES